MTVTTGLHARLPAVKIPQHRLFNPSTVQALINCIMRDMTGAVAGAGLGGIEIICLYLILTYLDIIEHWLGKF